MSVELPISSDTPMGRCLSVWHEFLTGDRSALERVLAPDVVLHSPVLFTPQHGKDLVAMYLTGASMTFVGERPSSGGEARSFRHPSGGQWDGRFHYIRTVVGEHDAVLEFETVMGGRYVNGVDMITCDDDGLIVDFKVMVRPLQAVEAVRELMFAALEQLKGDPG
jgi:hypothetical protein